MRKRRTYLFSVAAIIIAIILIAVFSSQSSRHARNRLLEPTRVVLGQAVIKIIPKTVTSVGLVIAPNTITLSAQQAGVIQGIYFTPGEQVKQNQLLLQINNANQEAAYQQQFASYQQTNVEYHRYLKMYQTYADAVSQEVLDEKLAAMRVALAQLNAARVNLMQTQIRAPFAGILTATQSLQNNNTNLDSQVETQLTVGSYLNLGDAVVTLTDPSHLLIQYQIPQQYATFLKLGQSITVTTTAYPTVVFHGTVNYISPVVLQTGAVYSVRALLEDDIHRLSPGMNVIVTQIIDPFRKILSVPGLSLMPAFNGYNVYTVQDGKIRSIPVSIGERFGPDVAIVSGLKAGQAVVIEGQNKVSPGAAVEVVSP